MVVQEAEVDCGFIMVRDDISALDLRVVEDIFHLEVQDLLFLTSAFVGVFLGFLEEFVSSFNDQILRNRPELLKVVENLLLSVKSLDGSFTSDVVKSDDTVLDFGGSEDLNPTDFRSIIAVSTAASLNVSVFDVDDSELVSWNNTSLVQSESVLELGLSLVHVEFLDLSALEDDSVGLVLNFDFLLLGQRIVMGDIKMGLLNSLLSTILPDMRTEDGSAGSKDNVSTSVVVSELSSAFFIDVS